MNIEEEIKDLEEQLCQAELKPDPDFFEKYLADDVVLVHEHAVSAPVRGKATRLVIRVVGHAGVGDVAGPGVVGPAGNGIAWALQNVQKALGGGIGAGTDRTWSINVNKVGRSPLF